MDLPPLPGNHGSPKPRWTDSTAPRTRPSVGLLGMRPPLLLRPCVWRAACRATGPSLRDSQPSPGREPPGAPRATPLGSPWRRTNLTGSAETAGENSATGSVPHSPTSSPTGSPFPPLRKRFGPTETLAGQQHRRRLGTLEETKQKATETIRNIDATWTIYTDDSAKDGTRDGGSAMVVTTGDPLDPKTIFSETIRGRMLTTSFDEEKEALRAAVRWLEDNTPNNSDKGLI